MVFLKRKLIFGSLTASKGQATVEYILLLFVVITLALSVGRPLGIYLTCFSGALVGPNGYYACLTKEGRLPGASSGCSMDLSQCTLPPGFGSGGFGGGSGGGGSGDGSGGGGSDDGSGDDSNNDGSDDSDNSGSGDTSGGDSSDDSGSSKDGGKNSGKTGSGSKDSSKNETGGDTSSASGSLTGDTMSGSGSKRQATFPAHLGGKNKSKKKRAKEKRYAMSALDSEGNQFKSGKRGYGREKFKMRGKNMAYLGERVFISEEENEKTPVFKVQAKGKTGGSGAEEGKKNKNLIQEKKRTDSTDSEDEDQRMDFKNFLKYFVIIALLIAIVMVVFSQVMEYQSRE